MSGNLLKAPRILSIENNINIHIWKVETAIDRFRTIWKSKLFDKMRILCRLQDRSKRTNYNSYYIYFHGLQCFYFSFKVQVFICLFAFFYQHKTENSLFGSGVVN